MDTNCAQASKQQPVPRAISIEAQKAATELVTIYAGDQTELPVISVGGCFVVPIRGERPDCTLSSLEETLKLMRYSIAETIDRTFRSVAKDIQQGETVALSRGEIFMLIDAERDYQDKKWGTTFDDKNTANDWTTYITQYASRIAPLKEDIKATKQALIKVAALAVAALETLERNWNFADRHYDK